MGESPFVLGAVAQWAGYVYAAYRRKARLVPGDLIHYMRREQVLRLRKVLKLPTAVLKPASMTQRRLHELPGPNATATTDLITGDR